MGANLPLSSLWKAALDRALPHLGSHTLLLDHPTGAALRALQHSTPDERHRTLVLTTSTVPEYLDDLWDLDVALLAVNVTDLPTFTVLLDTLRPGQRLRWQAPGSELTPAERRTLRLLAEGLTSKKIAQQLNLSERTVRNTQSRIYQKLGVKGRTEAALYYWGQQRPGQEPRPGHTER